MIRSTTCIDEYARMTSKTVSWYYTNPNLRFRDYGEGYGQKFSDKIDCSGGQMTDHTNDKWNKIKKRIHGLEQAMEYEQDHQNYR